MPYEGVTLSLSRGFFCYALCAIILGIVQTWDGLRLGLLALGYRRIIFLELACPTCGDFRTGIEEEAEFYYCPVCGRASKIALLGEGYTRRAEIPWEQVYIALPRCVHSDDRDELVAQRAARWRQEMKDSKPKRRYVSTGSRQAAPARI